jgi:hypothetical protein
VPSAVGESSRARAATFARRASFSASVFPRSIQGDGVARSQREGREDFELHPRELQRAAIHGGDARGEVEPERAHLDALAAPEGGPTEPRPHPLDELVGPEGLGHVVVGAELERPHLPRRVAARAQDEHRDIARPTDAREEVEAWDAGQHQVEHDEPVASEVFPRHRLAVRQPAGFEARAAEVPLELGAEGGVVFDHQNALAHRPRSIAAAP